MDTTQMNVRMDASLKRAGDAVISELGYTPSRVVRALWEYLSLQARVPRALEHVLNQGGVDSAFASPGATTHDRGASLVADFYKGIGVSEPPRPAPDYETLRDDWAADRLEEWELS